MLYTDIACKPGERPNKKKFPCLWQIGTSPTGLPNIVIGFIAKPAHRPPVDHQADPERGVCGEPNAYPQDEMCRNPWLVQGGDFYPTFLQRQHKRFPAG